MSFIVSFCSLFPHSINTANIATHLNYLQISFTDPAVNFRERAAAEATSASGLFQCPFLP